MCVCPTPQTVNELGAPGSLQTLLEVGESLGRQLWLWGSFSWGSRQEGPREVTWGPCMRCSYRGSAPRGSGDEGGVHEAFLCLV